jgi:excisionase family DNA binding protein
VNRLLTTAEVAEMLRVSPRTVRNWIDNESIPYVALPQSGTGRRECRIPLYGLLSSLSGSYDLAEQFEALDQPEAQKRLAAGRRGVARKDTSAAPTSAAPAGAASTSATLDAH